MLDAFLKKIVGDKITLYPAQEEAILEIFMGSLLMLFCANMLDAFLKKL